jgi:orotate phosphoribosyltransferase
MSAAARTGAPAAAPSWLPGLLKRTEALLEGHFLLSSGLHSDRYFQCARLLQHPRHAARVGRALGALCEPLGAELVVSPALGGIIIGHEVGRALGVRAIFTEREQGVMRLRRGFQIRQGERVLVVEDVVTTGKSTLEAAGAVAAAGGEVVGMASIVDRSGGASFPHPFRALLRLAVATYPPEACPLCREGRLPAIKPGSRQMPAPGTAEGAR